MICIFGNNLLNGPLLTTFLQFCACLYDLSSLATHMWLGPGIDAARENANQPKVNVLLPRQFSLNFWRSFLPKASCQYLSKMLAIASLRLVVFEKI